MCQKHERRCTIVRNLRDEALQEWSKAETLTEVRRAWSRLGGLTTLHRYGPGHFALLARHRHGDPEALPLLCAHMQRRKEVAR